MAALAPGGVAVGDKTEFKPVRADGQTDEYFGNQPSDTGIGGTDFLLLMQRGNGALVYPSPDVSAHPRVIAKQTSDERFYQ